MRRVVIFMIGLFLISHTNAASENDRFLSLPEKEKCDKRLMEAKYEGRNFFYSGHDPELKDTKLDWLDARNECRKRCMETISFKDQKKFDFFKSYIMKNNISFVWTSGRLCDFAGCEGRWDLLPKRIKGWLWSADQTRIDDTNKIPTNWNYTPWSRTGHFKKPQPDNAEFFISQVGESCLGVLNNQYNDSVGWHDIACYHKARFICEDSDALLYDVDHQEEEPIEVVTTTTSTTTRKPRVIAKILTTSTEATKEKSLKTSKKYETTTTKESEKIESKDIETTEKLDSTSIKPLDVIESSTSEATTTESTTKAPDAAVVKKFSRKIPRRRRTKTTTTLSTTTTTELPTTTLPETTEKSKLPLDSPSNDILLEDTTIEFQEEATTQTSTSTTTISPFRRKFPRRTRRKLKHV